MENIQTSAVALPEEKKLLTKSNFWCFALGTVGRDFAYNLFVTNLLTFIMFTKSLNNLQFTFVTVIIVGARIFDAFNDPIMGGIVENTRSKFGKFRPWILIGGATTSLVIVLLFSVPVDGWAFIGLLAVMYLLFSVTYTMNDISYWALLPHLARNTDDRNKLSAVTQLCVSAGGGLAMVGVPALTTQYSLGGNAITAYMWCSIICAVLFIASTLVTVLGVRDGTEVINGKNSSGKQITENRLSIKDMFRVLKNNDQLLIAALVMILFSAGSGVVTGGLSTTYVYFTFGYNGLLATLFAAIGGILSLAYTATFPLIMKKIGRTKLLLIGGLLIICGYGLMMVIGLTVPNGPALINVPILNLPINLKFILMMFPYGFALLGGSCFYNLMFLNISNTVEYNEWKTGKREESLIFALRPFTAKFSSALQQLLISVVYIAIGILSVTDGISNIEKQANQSLISTETKLESIRNLLASVPEGKINALLICMCVLPMIFLAGALFLYNKKFKLDDATYEKIKLEIAERAKNNTFVDGSMETLVTDENIEETYAEVASTEDNNLVFDSENTQPSEEE